MLNGIAEFLQPYRCFVNCIPAYRRAPDRGADARVDPGQKIRTVAALQAQCDSWP